MTAQVLSGVCSSALMFSSGSDEGELSEEELQRRAQKRDIMLPIFTYLLTSKTL